jgi:hypothetical protein
MIPKITGSRTQQAERGDSKSSQVCRPKHSDLKEAVHFRKTGLRATKFLYRGNLPLRDDSPRGLLDPKRIRQLQEAHPRVRLSYHAPVAESNI